MEFEVKLELLAGRSDETKHAAGVGDWAGSVSARIEEGNREVSAALRLSD